MTDIRYYAGRYKVEKLSGQSNMKTSMARAIEPHPEGRFEVGETFICPTRLLWRKPTPNHMNCPECSGELVTVFDKYLACSGCDRFFSLDLTKVSTKGKWEPYPGEEG